MSTDISPQLPTIDLENLKFAKNADGKIIVRVSDDDAIGVLNQILGALGGAVSATKTIFNVPLTIADTEVSLVLPTTVVGYMIRTRGNGNLKLSHVSGESGTKYITIPSRATYKDDHSYSNLTLYFQSPTAGEVVEVVAWE